MASASRAVFVRAARRIQVAKVCSSRRARVLGASQGASGSTRLASRLNFRSARP